MDPLQIRQERFYSYKWMRITHHSQQKYERAQNTLVCGVTLLIQKDKKVGMYSLLKCDTT
jgi:hypothetical protein